MGVDGVFNVVENESNKGSGSSDVDPNEGNELFETEKPSQTSVRAQKQNQRKNGLPLTILTSVITKRWYCRSYNPPAKIWILHDWPRSLPATSP